MDASDFSWAAVLMERRRERYSSFSPVFWRPATGVTGMHAQFMQTTAARDGAVALRTDHGFALSYPHEGRCFVDDFAVEDDAQWAAEGRSLLLAVWNEARSADQPILRVVTAREDEPKRAMLAEVGLEVSGRWWLKELTPTGEAATWGPVRVGELDALLMPAPPVYDPGGPVCVLGDVPAAEAITASEAAAELGAVLTIVQREGAPSDAPAWEPELERAGFHNPSEFYEGVPR
jgi:hypothetical protein